MEPLTPIYTAGLFQPLHAKLLALLRGLGTADWDRPTIAGAWRVKDVAGHLLEHIEEDILTLALPVGHGAALHYPDQPWARWHYIDGKNNFISRHNLPDFVEAAEIGQQHLRVLDQPRPGQVTPRILAVVRRRLCV